MVKIDQFLNILTNDSLVVFYNFYKVGTYIAFTYISDVKSIVFIRGK